MLVDSIIRRDQSSAEKLFCVVQTSPDTMDTPPENIETDRCIIERLKRKLSGVPSVG